MAPRAAPAAPGPPIGAPLRAAGARSLRVGAVGLLLAATREAASAEVELPLSWGALGTMGLCNAELGLGTPPQRVTVSVDSGSAVLWVPGRAPGSPTPGFAPEKSSTLQVKRRNVQLAAYADGLQVGGEVVQEVVQLGPARVEAAPLLVRNLSMLPPTAAQGLPGYTRHQQQEVDGIMGLSCPRGDKEPVDGFLCQYLRGLPEEVPRTVRLELGAPQARMVLGEELVEGPRDQGYFRFASGLFSDQTSLWYASVRALGLQGNKRCSSIVPWTGCQISSVALDFNSADQLRLPGGVPAGPMANPALGVAALLDSGAAAIRVGSGLFEVFLAAMPEGCKRAGAEGAPHPSIECSACEEDLSAFPTITLSFEASGNFRFLGLDAGSDFLTCIPPAAYVHRDAALGLCRVAIVDGGRTHIVFNTEAIVLGVPFFRSVAVAYDLRRQQVAIGPLAPAANATGGGPACVCTDPKNWWSTGKRLSWRRVLLCLSFTSAIAAYVFIGYSPSPLADTVRQRLSGGFSAGVSQLRASAGARGLPGGRRGADGTGQEMTRTGDRDDSGFVALHSDVER